MSIAFVASTSITPSATAVSPYSSADWVFHAGTNANTGICSVSIDGTTPSNAAVPTDGAGHTVEQSYVSTVSADATDYTKLTYSQRATGSLGAQGANPSKISLAYSGRASITQSRNPPGCQLAESYIDTKMEFSFTLTQPMWLDATLLARGNVYSTFDIETDGNKYIDLYNNALNYDIAGSVYLPAGAYTGYLEANTLGELGQPLTASGTLTATFTKPGIRTSGPAGTAKPYVAYPAGRDCAAHNAALRLTDSTSLAKTIKKAVVSVNGHRVRTIRSGFRNRPIPLALADDSAATVRTTITTVRKKHGKTIRKIRTVTASYRACS